MSYLESFILGLAQGLTEFLPVSSSGHLALMQYYFGIRGDQVLLFTVLLHLGTLISVFIAYRKDIWELIVELGLTFKDIFTGKGLRLGARPVRKLGVMIIVATIPTGIIGLVFNDFFEGLYHNVAAIALGLIFTGVIMFIAERMGAADKSIREMKFRDALVVGVMQGVAICPGISRSGSTLVGGLGSGLNRAFAVKFAFLISIPSILGSLVLELPEAVAAGIDTALIGPVILGMVVAAVSGLFAIKAMIKLVSNKKLSYFSYYVWAVAAVVLVEHFFFSV